MVQLFGNFGFIYLGDDKTCTITGKGQTKIALDDGGVRTLSEVRYFPDFKLMVIHSGHMEIKIS